MKISVSHIMAQHVKQALLVLEQNSNLTEEFMTDVMRMRWYGLDLDRIHRWAAKKDKPTKLELRKLSLYAYSDFCRMSREIELDCMEYANRGFELIP